MIDDCFIHCDFIIWVFMIRWEGCLEVVISENGIFVCFIHYCNVHYCLVLIEIKEGFYWWFMYGWIIIKQEWIRKVFFFSKSSDHLNQWLFLKRNSRKRVHEIWIATPNAFELFYRLCIMAVIFSFAFCPCLPFRTSSKRVQTCI